MSQQQRSATLPAATGGGNSAAAVQVGLLALVLSLGVTALTVAGVRLFIPFNLMGGFTFNLGITTVVTAVVVAFAVWRFAGLGAGGALAALVLFFVVPVAVSFGVNYTSGKIMENLSTEQLTNSTNFYGILILKSAFSALSILVVGLFFSAAFRKWGLWVTLIVIWAGGDAFLFMLYKNGVYTRDIYQWLYPIERTLGFIAIAYFIPVGERRAH